MIDSTNDKNQGQPASGADRLADDRNMRAATHGTATAPPTEPPHVKSVREEIRPASATGNEGGKTER